jgi:hypothetical protein
MLTTRAVLDGIGVNTHWQNASQPTDPPPHAPQTNVADMVADLKTLGVTAIRDRAPPLLTDSSHSYSVQKLGALFAGGVKTYCMLSNEQVVGGVRSTFSLPAQITAIKALLATVPHLTALIEGCSEPQYWGVTYAGLTDGVANGFAATARYQADLYAAARADPALAAVQIAAPAWDGPVPAAPAPCDIANQHVYPYDGPPTPGEPLPFVSAKRSALLAPYGDGKPWIVTECGYSDDVGGGTMAVDAATQARLTLCLLMQLFRLGCSRAFLYALYDDATPDKMPGWGAGCGLFDYRRAIKPVGRALANLLGYLGGAAVPLAGDAPVFTEPAGAFLLPMRRGAGIYDLAVWNEPVLWDWKARGPIALPPQAATVALPFTASEVEVYDPVTGAVSVQLNGGVTSVSVSLTGYPLILRVKQ